MPQQTLIYSFVARGMIILAEYTEFTGNFTSIAFQCLQKLPAMNTKFTYNCDGHTFNYLVEGGFSEYILCFSFLSSFLRQIRRSQNLNWFNLVLVIRYGSFVNLVL